MTQATTLWQAVMATHQVAVMWPLADDEGRRVQNGGKRNSNGVKTTKSNG